MNETLYGMIQKMSFMVEILLAVKHMKVMIEYYVNQ